MLNPLDWRTVLLAKHAQHVAIIHFPIALFIMAVILDGLATWTKRAAFATAAFFNLSAAALAVPPTILTGLLAWQWQLEGQRLKGILLYHLLAAGGASLLIVLNWLIHYQARRRSAGVLPGWRLPLEFIGVALVMLTGHLGGFLSGVNG